MPAATFTPVDDVVSQATSAGFFPGRHAVDVTDVRRLSDGVFRLTFRDGYIAAHAKAAQFVNLFSHDSMMLMPRPFGVSEVRDDLVSVIFAVVGKGTQEFSRLHAGDRIDPSVGLAGILPQGTDLHRPDMTHFHPFQDPADAARIIREFIPAV